MLPKTESFKTLKKTHTWRTLLAALALLGTFSLLSQVDFQTRSLHAQRRPLNAEAILDRCSALRQRPGPPPDFHSREQSDRYEPGTNPVLLRNAKIWTGARNGTEIVYGDVLLDKGIIKAIGYVPNALLRRVNAYGELDIVDVNGAWVTPGLVDIHSHIGVMPVPVLAGAFDGNSPNGPILPWLRSLDGINTHDASYEQSIAGGVTSAQVLPGSSNAIGGQAFVIKLRKTIEGSPSSKVIEPPYTLNGTTVDPKVKPRWRHMKHACGENLIRFGTRMDTAWNYRNAYNQAKSIKEAQDAYCERVEEGQWEGLGPFPESLQWEALVDVLRGRVKISIHCYEETDFDAIVRLTNEFKFPIGSYHHASEAFLVPDLIKKTWREAGSLPPAIALFAIFGRYKREAYRASEFAPRILSEHGLRVIMKSDHPVLNERFVLFEAQQAHYYGLRPDLALAAVTSTPAGALGLDHRIGVIKEGYDADIVIWDSHPLALGATPKQVYIDGIPQLDRPAVHNKPASFQGVPSVPNFDQEAKDAVEYEGLPPLEPKTTKDVVFINVKSVWRRDLQGIMEDNTISGSGMAAAVVVKNGRIVCTGSEVSCLANPAWKTIPVIDLQGGVLAPGLTSFGGALGLREIHGEPSTSDGDPFDPFSMVPPVIGDSAAIVRAVDGLQLGGRHNLLAYRSGVTYAVTSPTSFGFVSGLSTAFRLGAFNALEKGAVTQEVVALHLTISHPPGMFPGHFPSISSEVAALRRSLLDGRERYFKSVAEGKLPLVINTDSADIMASLLRMKADVERETGISIRLTFVGGLEAHLLAKEIAAAGVGVILLPSHPYPAAWDSRRIIPGPPLSEQTAISVLLSHNITVGIGVPDEVVARNARFDLAWAAIDAGGKIGHTEAFALASTNIEQLLGIEHDSVMGDLVAYSGGDPFGFSSKVVAVVSEGRGQVDLF